MPNRQPLEQDLPEALVDERRRVSLVWLIPLVALLAAAWLGHRAYTQAGPLVTIGFDTAEGLEAGKTRVRFKDVDVGVVEAIELSAYLSEVRVRARLSSNVEPFLNDRTRFWVARPRLSGGQVSGLGTLLAGTYIGVDLSTDGVAQRTFEGLETPPVVTANEPGKTFRLQAGSLGSIAEGAPVLYRGIEVGRVVTYRLDDPDGVEIQIFVKAPYDARVHGGTRFWNVSGVRLSLDAAGVEVSADSLTSILVGGIAFGMTPETGGQPPAADGTAFPLFASEQAARERRVAHRQTWRMAFAGSVRGLAPGAPVEFRGIRIGTVTDLALDLDADDHLSAIPVSVGIEPGRLGIGVAGDDGTPPAAHRALWDRLVANGLRAQIRTANLVSGAQYVDLDFYPADTERTIDWSGEVPQFPTVPTPLDELRSLLGRLARLPVDRLGEELIAGLGTLQQTLESMNTLLGRLDRETVVELNRTLAQTRNALGGLERVLAPGSPLQADAQRVLQEFGAAARSLRIMADYLERHPEALIRGKGGIAP